eukprot:scaffold130901_cov39-Phaeocystis_antarctica.AAC.1
MLVIATSVPDEREWIQWKGRTARQDRPGQYHVVLNTRAKPFEGNKELLKKVRSAPSPNPNPSPDPNPSPYPT